MTNCLLDLWYRGVGTTPSSSGNWAKCLFPVSAFRFLLYHFLTDAEDTGKLK